MSYKTYLLRVGSEHDEFFETINTAIESLYEKQGIYFTFAFSNDFDPDVFIYTWLGSVAGNEIEVVDDFISNTRYMTILMEPDEQAGSVARYMADKLGFLTYSDLKEDVANSPGNPDALVRLGLGSSVYDPEAAELIGKGLRSQGCDIRRAAVKAASLTAWPELKPSLVEALSCEDDEIAISLFKYAIAKCDTAP